MNKVMHAIIVEDDKLNATMLEDLIKDQYADEIALLKVCRSGSEAVKVLGKEDVDLIFLDVELPDMNAFELLEKLKSASFEIIFTTSHNKYAIDALRHSAFDYLLKPIDQEALAKSIKRLREKINKASENQLISLLKDLKRSRANKQKVALPTGDGLELIKLHDIVRCESDSNYTTVFLIGNKKLVISKTLKEITELIDHPDFFRVHHSHLINLNKVQKYIRGSGGHVIMEDNATVSVARNKKDEFLQLFGAK